MRSMEVESFLTYLFGAHLLEMFEVPTDSTTIPKQHESGPNYFAYYKHLVLNLLSRDGKCIIPFTEVDSAGSVGKCFGGEAKGSHNDDRKVNYFSGSCSYFTKTFGEGLSEFKEERLLATLNESAVCLNREADEMLDLILATLEIDSNIKEKEQLPRYSNAASNKDLSMPLNSKKRKANSNSPKSKYSGRNSISFRQVYNNIQALQGQEEICHEDVEKYTFQLLAKLDKMEENLDEYLNVVVSNSRPMTRIEKHRLGKDIRKLPDKALNHVVEILQPNNFSAKDFPESVVVNLEEQLASRNCALSSANGWEISTSGNLHVCSWMMEHSPFMLALSIANHGTIEKIVFIMLFAYPIRLEMRSKRQQSRVFTASSFEGFESIADVYLIRGCH